jgi:tRNA threonylcarbamoyladenosine biosynthesis protein TsaB
VLLLALETATDVCSAALHDGARVIADAAVRLPRSHAARLAPMIEGLLDHVGARPGDLDTVAVSAGPGSYTGLRIGASTAKGLAFAAGAALVAVPSLEAMALAAQPPGIFGGPLIEGFRYLAVFPSRRGEVYAAYYQRQWGKLECRREASAVALAEIGEWLRDGAPVSIVGPAADTVATALESQPTRGGWHVLDAEPSAISVAEIGLRKLKAGEVENVAAWEPYYLKAFVAGPPRPIFGKGESEST